MAANTWAENVCRNNLPVWARWSGAGHRQSLPSSWGSGPPAAWRGGCTRHAPNSTAEREKERHQCPEGSTAQQCSAVAGLGSALTSCLSWAAHRWIFQPCARHATPLWLAMSCRLPFFSSVRRAKGLLIWSVHIFNRKIEPFLCHCPRTWITQTLQAFIMISKVSLIMQLPKNKVKRVPL